MKKMLFILLAVVSTAAVFATEPAPEPTTTEVNYLWRDGYKIYQGQERLTQREYKNLLQNTCPEAFAQYRKGTILANTGWGLLGGGTLLIFGVGFPVQWAKNPYPSKNPHGPFPIDDVPPPPTQAEIEQWEKHQAFDHAQTTTFIWCVCLGTGLGIVGIPLIAAGYPVRNKSLSIYNQQCLRKEPAITYSLTAGQNGIGVAINF